VTSRRAIANLPEPVSTLYRTELLNNLIKMGQVH
jgi:hypothetical protein